METNGQVNTNTAYDSFFWVKWSTESQNIAENYTTINWSCGVTPGHQFGTNAIKMSSVYINGSYVYAGGTYSNFLDYQEHTLASGKLKIPHNPDGTKTFYISSFTGWLWENNNYSSSGGGFELPAIPRAARLEDATDFTDLQMPTVTYNNPAGDSVTTLQAYIYDTDDTTVLVGGMDLEKTATSAELQITPEEIDNLRNAATDGSKKVWFYIKTELNGATYWSKRIEKTFSVEASEATEPTITMRVTLENGSLPTKFDGLYIQGKSKVKVELSAEGKYGADIQSYSVVVDGKTYNSANFTSDVIQNPGEVKIIGYAKDSRQITGSAEKPINVIEYSKPLVTSIYGENAIQCYRSDEDGNRTGNSDKLWIKAKRSYYSVNGKNTCKLQWRWKKASEEWPEEEEWYDLLSDDAADNEYNRRNEYSFDLKEAYTVQIRAIDDFGEFDIRTQEVPTQDVALHLGRGGKNVAIGTYCDYSDEYTFYSAWKAKFGNGLRVDGGIQVGDTPLLDLVYPVGSIYISVSEKNPGDLFGGTWEQLQDRFLLGAGGKYAIGATSGEETHVLTVAELPKHGHGITYLQDGGTFEGKWGVNWSAGDAKTSGTEYVNSGISETGAGAPHNNMPPYLAVYMWQRTG